MIEDVVDIAELSERQSSHYARSANDLAKSGSTEA
jgi:hypothetical protein